jgi:hypothetical protein
MIWRLIHNEEYVIDLMETNDITATVYTIFEAGSLQECFDEIDKKKLNYLYCIDDEEGILFVNGIRTYIQLKDID